MTERLPSRGALPCAVALFAVLLVPPVRNALEASMTMQMLVQIPLLAGVGMLLARALPRRALVAIEPWNRHGASALVLASFAAALWMLPRALDAAVNDPLAAAAKHVSLPLAVGLPLALAWPRMGFIARGVLLLESVATLFRLGWLYSVSTERLCNNYLLGDQQQLGRWLLALGAMLSVTIACKLLWGRFALPAETRPGASG